MKKLVVIFISLLPPFAMAGGWTNEATVNDVEIIRGQGFLISGEYGNPSECTASNRIYVAISHPQYESLLSVALSAFMADKKLKIYSHQCSEIGWHGGSYNQLTGSGAMYIKN